MMVAKKTTKGRILEATERLLAEHGFESVSLRDITTAAEVNVAAVNYHFGSKEKLFEAVSQVVAEQDWNVSSLRLEAGRFDEVFRTITQGESS